MIAFRVTLNRESPVVAGIGPYGVLTTVVTWVAADPDRTCAPGQHFTQPPREHIDVHIGGLRDNEHMDWLNRYIAVGDCIGIEVIDTEVSDPPTARRLDAAARAFELNRVDFRNHLRSELQALNRELDGQAFARRCSFCSKEAAQVDTLISGPSEVYICNECVAVCTKTLKESHT